MSTDLTRRKVIKLGASSLAGAAVASNSAVLAQTSPQAPAVIPSRPDARSYDFVIIGTGFGATIAATILVEKAGAQNKPISILMLERGVWWVTPQNLGFPKPGKPPIPEWASQPAINQPVNYWPRPDHKEGLLSLLATLRRPGHIDGLFQYSSFKQADILTASGVGGGSLIYSNVTIKPQSDVLKQIGLNLDDAAYTNAYNWMGKYRGQLNKIVTKIPLPGRKVEDLVIRDQNGNYTDDAYLLLDRSRFLHEAAQGASKKLGIEIPWNPLELSVIEYNEQNGKLAGDAKNAHTHCERQGRCMLGCLPQARHTLNKTIYRQLLTEKTGVALAPLAEVRYIEKASEGYRIHYTDNRVGDNVTISTRNVILAAGTLGTTEILLRSRDRGGLQLSPLIGHKFSTNGDFGGFCVTPKKKPVYSTRGPINTAHLLLKMTGSYVAIEDCAIPSMFAEFAANALKVIENSDLRGRFIDKLKFAFESGFPLEWESLFPKKPHPSDPASYPTEAEMVANLFFFNSMGQDPANGKFSLRDDKLDLDWDIPIADHPIFAKIETAQIALSEAMGAKYIPFPLWKGFANKKLIVTHPLGGCPIGKNSAEGVVDEFGRIFDGSAGAASDRTLPGLYIVDGSAIPGALVANPTLTISAQAFKAVNQIAV